MSRTSFTGPVKGAYHSEKFTFVTVANNDNLLANWVVPAAFRVCRVSAYATTVTSDPTYSVSNGAPGGTDTVAARNMPATATLETITPTSTTPLANRNYAQDDIMQVNIIADAGDAATNLVIVVSGYFIDHMVSAGGFADPND